MLGSCNALTSHYSSAVSYTGHFIEGQIVMRIQEFESKSVCTRVVAGGSCLPRASLLFPGPCLPTYKIQGTDLE